MKKLAALILAIAALGCAPVNAQHHHHHHHSRVGDNWVAPLIGGVIIGTIISRPAPPPPVIIQQPPVVVQQPPYYGPVFREYYSCLVQVYDPYSGQYRNEVQTCMR